MLTSSNGTDPDGILEVKTGADAENWANGVPLDYRPQVLDYLDATGFQYAHVAVKIDDREYRSYRIAADEPVSGVPGDPTMAESRDKLTDVWNRWQGEKANPPEPKPNNGTFAWVKAPKSDSSVEKNRKVAAELAAYRGITHDEAHSLIATKVAAGTQPDAAIRSLYRAYDPTADTARTYVVFDTETNSLSAGKGAVIQSGAVVINGQGDVLERIDELHGIDPRAARTIGTGEEHIHQIAYRQIHGKPQFRKSHAHKRIRELLADPKATLVAHNAGFEKRFLAAAGIRVNRVIDTMTLTRRFDNHIAGAKLKNFAEAHGVAYTGAHNAHADADITARSLLSFWRNVQKAH